MNRAFTLIELIVVTAIISFMAVISGPALSPELNRANLNAASTQIRDLITQTQTFAIGPEKEGQSDYLLVLNFGTGTHEPDNGSGTCFVPPNPDNNLAPGTYGIYSIAETNPPHTPETASPCGRVLIKTKTGKLQSSGITSYSINYPLNAVSVFKVHFRTSDYFAGFGGMYSDYSCPFGTLDPCQDTWESLWNRGGTASDYAEIVIKGKNQTKFVQVNKVTGETEIIQ